MIVAAALALALQAPIALPRSIIVLPPCCQRSYGQKLLDELMARPDEPVGDTIAWLDQRVETATPKELFNFESTIDGLCIVQDLCTVELASARSHVQRLRAKREAEADRRTTLTIGLGGMLATLIGTSIGAVTTWAVMRKPTPPPAGPSRAKAFRWLRPGR